MIGPSPSREHFIQICRFSTVQYASRVCRVKRKFHGISFTRSILVRHVQHARFPRGTLATPPRGCHARMQRENCSRVISALVSSERASTDGDGVDSSSGVDEAEELRLPGNERRRHAALTGLGDDAEDVRFSSWLTGHAQTKERRLELHNHQQTSTQGRRN